MRNISSEKAKGEFRKIKDPGSIPSGQKADPLVMRCVCENPHPNKYYFATVCLMAKISRNTSTTPVNCDVFFFSRTV